MFELHHGDCLDIMPTIEAGSVDMVITSPPYGSIRTYNGNNAKWSDTAWKCALAEIHTALCDGGVAVWIVDDQHIGGGESLTHMRQALWWTDHLGGLCHDTMIWDKGGFASVGNLSVRYAQVFEYMLVLSKGRPTIFNPLKDRKNKVQGVRRGTIRNPDGTMKRMSTEGNQHSEYGQRFNIWSQTPCRERSIAHPARFPVQIVIDHVLSWSNEGGTVLDPFMGSGTTGVACANTGRKFIGIELDAGYFEIARGRVSEAYGCVH